MKQRYIYTYYHDPFDGKLCLDVFYKLQTPDLTDDPLKVAMRLAPDFFNAEAKVIGSIKLRARFQNSVGPKIVTTDFELTRADFQEYLRAKHELGEPVCHHSL